MTFSHVYLFQHIASLNQKGVFWGGGRVEFLELRQSSYLLVHTCIVEGYLFPPSFSLGFNYFTYILIQVTHKT